MLHSTNNVTVQSYISKLSNEWFSECYGVTDSKNYLIHPGRPVYFWNIKLLEKLG